MVVDLIILTIIGSILEGLATKFSGAVFGSSPTFTFAFLIVFVAIARWNLWGLVTIPFVAAASWLGGHFNDLNYLAAAYDYRSYLSTCFGLVTLAVNVIFFKTIGNKKITKSIPWLLFVIIVDYLLYTAVQFVSYRLICGNITGNQIIYEFNMWFDNVEVMQSDGTIKIETIQLDEPIVKQVNVCSFIEGGIVYNLFGLAITFIGGIVLGSQGILSNCLEKFVEDKKEKELMNKDTETFAISDSPEDLEESSKEN